MKEHFYVYRIIYLKTHRPIKLTENILLCPNYIENKERKDSKFTLSYNVECDVNSFSYLIIKKEKIIQDNELKKDIELILSLFSILLSNQFYYKENYHFILDKENNFSLENALIVSFPERTIKKERDILFTGLHIREIQENFNELHNNLLRNPISDSLFYIIAIFMASLRESVFEIKASLIWDVLEYMATRYWKVIDTDKLYIIKKEKFKDFIKELKEIADNFLEKNNDKKNDVLLTGSYSKIYDYKILLKQNITDKIKNFSPIKYKIFSLFENENIPLSQEEINRVKIMQDIRNWIHHNGLSLTEIKQKMIKKEIDEDPIQFVFRFVAFVHRKILEYIGVVDKFAYFYRGHLIFKRDRTSELEIRENSEVDINFKEKRIINKIIKIHDHIKSLRDRELDATMHFNELNYEVKIKISYDKGRSNNTLRIINPPLVCIQNLYSDLPEEISLPEDIIKISQNLEFKIKVEKYQIKFIIKSPPIDQKISIKFPLPKSLEKFRKNDESDYIDFNIDEIYIFRN